MKRLLLIMTLMLIVTASVAGQTPPERKLGSISGTVIDAVTKEPILGAVLWISGAEWASTNAAGGYATRSFLARRCTVACTHIGYVPLKMEDVVVVDGRTLVDFSLFPATDPCFESLPESAIVVATQSRVYLALPVRLKGADGDIFLCAAQVAGSFGDPSQQADALPYVINQACAAGKIDQAVTILESIGDESVLSTAIEGIDSVSLEDRYSIDWRKAWSPGADWTKFGDSDPIKPFGLHFTSTQLQRLHEITFRITEPEAKARCAAKEGLLLSRFGSRPEALTVLRSVLPVLDSVQACSLFFDFGSALLVAGDTATGLDVLARALAVRTDSLHRESFWWQPYWACLYAIIETGAYDIALKAGSQFEDSAQVRSKIALRLAEKGLCDEALKQLSFLPAEPNRVWLWEDASFACAQQGARVAAMAALTTASHYYFGDSARHGGHPAAIAYLVDSYARSGFLDEAYRLTSSIVDPLAHSHALLSIGEQVLKSGRRSEADSIFRRAISNVKDLQDTYGRDDALERAVRTLLKLHQLGLSRETIPLVAKTIWQFQLSEDLALGYVECDSCEQALAIAQELDDPDERISLEMLVADSCLALGRKAIALRIVDEIGDSTSVLNSFVYCGEDDCRMTAISIYARCGEMEKAAKVVKRWEHTGYEPVALIKMAEGYIGIGEPKNALPLLSAARKACRNLRLEPNTQPRTETWQDIAYLYAQAGAFAEALQTVREMNTSPRYASETLADLALAFSKTGRELISAEKKKLRQIISQYCK